MKTIFLNSENIIVQMISGLLDDQSKKAFLRDYGMIYHAVSILEVDDSTRVWIGGTYDPSSGEFLPPPSPEPELMIEEPTI